jgi:hypothetical protein
MYADNELLFPPHAILPLRAARGPVWKDLVDRVASLPDAFRAMRGCVACSHQVLHRYKGPDVDLVKRYSRCLHEVRSHLGLPEEADLAARAA